MWLVSGKSHPLAMVWPRFSLHLLLSSVVKCCERGHEVAKCSLHSKLWINEEVEAGLKITCLEMVKHFGVVLIEYLVHWNCNFCSLFQVFFYHIKHKYKTYWIKIYGKYNVIVTIVVILFDFVTTPLKVFLDLMYKGSWPPNEL